MNRIDVLNPSGESLFDITTKGPISLWIQVNSEDIPLLFNPTKNGNETQALASTAKLMQST